MVDSFWGNIFKGGKKSSEKLADKLKKIPIFKDLNRKELAAVERIMHRREFQPKEVIFHQGDPGMGMYIIEEGSVDVIFEPTQQILAHLHDGDFFGELALIDDSPRSAIVIAKTNCKMLGLFQSDLFDLVERNPKLGVKIIFQLLSVVGNRLKKSNEQVQMMQIKLHKLRKRSSVSPKETE